MTSAVDDLQRFGLKLFLEPDTSVDVRAFILVFHRWIQTKALDELLIDVADYTHLSDGPSVLLAGHEGNYAIDRSEDRLGLYYYRKQPAAGSLGDRLVAVGRALLRAAILLEGEDSPGARCRFRGNEIQFVANDRLLAPVADTTTELLRPTVAAFGSALFRGQVEHQPEAGDPGDRVRLTVRSRANSPLVELLKNIS